MADTDLDYEEMSDADFMNLMEPAPAPEMETEGSEAVDEASGDTSTEATIEEGTDADAVVAAGSIEDHTTPQQTAANPDAGSLEEEPAPANSDPEAKAPQAQATEAPLNYEDVYKKIMAPFKANGREFTPTSPEEVVRLMQMGANYTKKMQALQPNLKLMRMLDNNGLLDEGKLSFLIDLSRKDQGAIQKLLADSKIDPLDLNTEAASSYRPGNHSVSDQEMAFSETLSEVMATTEGKETVRMVNSSWDAASKQAIYQEPAILQILTEQRANGIFDRISAEIDRQKMLGGLTNVPFIQAYKMVGDALMSQGKLIPNQASTQSSTQGSVSRPQPIETRAAVVRSPVTNNAAARAASPARSAAKPVARSFDPLTMSDEEIMALSSPGSLR